MSDSKTPAVSSYRGLTSQQLARAIFRAELTPDVIRSLPAQSLYMAVRHSGLASSAEILEAASIEQLQLMLDFDCWTRDRFSEQRFWEWLAVSDSSGDLGMLQRLLRCVDLKLISLVISREVDSQFFEEPTDLPPGPAYYTPDKGRCWIRVKTENPDQHFLLGRLLALIFETNADLFYQLLTIASTETQSSLEESSYQDRCRRVGCEGVPDAEFAARLNAALGESALASKLQGGGTAPVSNILAVEPLLYDSPAPQPLAAMLSQVGERERLEMELTLLMNAAIVHYGVDFAETEEVALLAAKVRGAINIGIERSLRCAQITLVDLHNRLGLRGLYSAGLDPLQRLNKAARKRAAQITGESSEPATLVLLEAFASPLPCLPDFFGDDGSMLQSEDGKLLSTKRPFSHLEQVEAALRYVAAMENM